MASNQIRVLHVTGLPGLVLYRGTEVTHAYPRHWHEELHVCVYTRGEGRLRVRGEVHAIGAGDLTVTPAGEVHENWVTDRSSCTFRSVYLPLPLLRSTIRQLAGRTRGDLSFAQPRLSAPALRSTLMALHACVESGDAGARVEELVTDLCRGLLAASLGGSDGERPVGCERVAVRRVQELLQERCAESVSLRELAAVSGLSPAHLHRVFSRQTGMPPHAFQLQVRINRAKQLLGEGRAPADVAASTGFADQSHLSRHFHRRVGLPPGRFRRGGFAGAGRVRSAAISVESDAPARP